MLTNFQQKVYRAVQLIPKGKVATYKQIAKLAGRPKAFRAVGSIMHRNPNAAKTPCHRVVASDGSLSGYAFGKGIVTKRQLLLKEGVIFVGNKVDLKKSGWDKNML